MASKRGNILWVPSYERDLKSVLKGVMLMGIDMAQNIIAACGTTNKTFSNHVSATNKI